MNCQIVHDSIHRRAGWTRTYLLTVGEAEAGDAAEGRLRAVREHRQRHHRAAVVA